MNTVQILLKKSTNVGRSVAPYESDDEIEREKEENKKLESRICGSYRAVCFDATP